MGWSLYSLGEQFRAIWDVEPALLDSSTSQPQCRIYLDSTAPSTSYSSNSAPTTASHSRASSLRSIPASPKLAPTTKAEAPSSSSASSLETDDQYDTPGTSLAEEEEGPVVPEDEPLDKAPQKARIVFLNEQVSHHPPVSSVFCSVLLLHPVYRG